MEMRKDEMEREERAYIEFLPPVKGEGNVGDSHVWSGGFEKGRMGSDGRDGATTPMNKRNRTPLLMKQRREWKLMGRIEQRFRASEESDALANETEERVEANGTYRAYHNAADNRGVGEHRELCGFARGEPGVDENGDLRGRGKEQARRGGVTEVRVSEPSQVREGAQKKGADVFGVHCDRRAQPRGADRDAQDEGVAPGGGDRAQEARVLGGAGEGERGGGG
jgi:hypothetical protein